MVIFLTEKIDKSKFILKLLKVLGVVCFVAAAWFILIVILMHNDKFIAKYDQYLIILQDFENKVYALQDKWLIIIVIFLLYLLRSLSMMYPYNVLYIISAMVFPPVWSFIINLSGMAFTFAFRYYTGIQMGEGYLNNILKRYPMINSVFEVEGRGSPFVLFALRVVPFFPINTLSQLYGTIEYPFGKYMLLSVIAMIPRLISYSFIGNSVYDPLSSSFFVPLTVLLIFTGCSMFFLRAVLGLTFRSKIKHLKERKKDNV